MKKAAAISKGKKTPETIAVEKYRPRLNKQAEVERKGDEIPADFIEALDDFDHGRFVSMETALNEAPPDSK
jgi:hypothetical protein